MSSGLPEQKKVDSTEVALASVEALAAEIQSRREARLAKEIKAWPKRNTYASNIPVCARQGVYEIVAWKDKKLHDTHLQARFEKGKQEEKSLIRELMDLGFDIVEEQSSISPDICDKYRISGRIDGKLVWDRRRVPFEIKSMNPLLFKNMNTLEDVRDDDFFARNYRQMLVYLLGNNEEAGLLILTDCLGHWKFIPIPLDYAEAEKVLQKVEAINRGVDSGELPPRLEPYEHKVCGRCAFAHICCPDIINRSKVVFSEDTELAALLKRRDELAQSRAATTDIEKEWDEVNDRIKAKVGTEPLVSVGKWTISGKWMERKSVKLPDELKKQYQVVSKYYKLSIEAAE